MWFFITFRRHTIVHKRPEILEDIDRLLGTSLSKEWKSTHVPYEIVAKVKGKNIVYEGYEEDDLYRRTINYITKAYWSAFHSIDEEILLMKNNICIPPEDIIEIKRFDTWDY